MSTTRRAVLSSAAAATLPMTAVAEDAARIRRGYVQAWTGQVHMRSAGQRGVGKRPLLCFHPSLASGLNFVPLLAELGRDRFVVAPDTPGAGMSDPPPAPPAIADYARAMADVADELRLTEYDLLGAHTGSLTCVELARLRPAQVKHVVLLSAPVHTEEGLKRLRARNVVEGPDADGAFLVRAWKSQLGRRDPRAELKDVMRKFPEHLMGGDTRAWGQAAAFAYHVEQTIGLVEAPVMVLNPGGDLYDLTLAVGRLLKNGRLINRPDWRSSMLEFDTAAAAELLRAFFDRDTYPAL